LLATRDQLVPSLSLTAKRSVFSPSGCKVRPVCAEILSDADVALSGSVACRNPTARASGIIRRAIAVVCLVLDLLGLVAVAEAQVVALGASNTRGMGVAFEEAYPAQLDAMLRAKGYRGHVLNAGISGDTTAGMLARLDSAVSPDTRVVILQPGANDLRRRGSGPVARDANVDHIVSRLSARGIQVVMLNNDMLHAVPDKYRQADWGHLTPEGYRLLASWLVLKVAPLLGLPPG
jgi:acyl-CoA thioesterase I